MSTRATASSSHGVTLILSGLRPITRPVNQTAPMKFWTVLLHPGCLALAVKGGRFHTALTCTCQPASTLSCSAVTALCLPFDFSLPRPLLVLLSGFQLPNCCLQGCAGEAEGYGFVLSDIWGFHYISRHLLNTWKRRDVIGADMTTLGAVSLTWNYTRVNHPHQFLPPEIALELWFFKGKDMNSSSRCEYLGGNSY